MQISSRTNSSDAYRYGFNGKEKEEDGEFGSLTHYDYGFRIYNPGIGRFLSVDPLTKDYAMLTPYQFASNSTIAGIDLDGLEFYYAADGSYIGQYGTSTELRVVPSEHVEYTKRSLFGFEESYKPDNKYSLKAYDNPDQAALEWAYEYNGKTHLDNAKADNIRWKSESGRNRKEYGAIIGSKSTSDENGNPITLYILGSIVSNEKGEVDVMRSSILSGWSKKYAIHTHPIRGGEKNGEIFSGDYDPLTPWIKGDTYYAKRYKINFYLATPKGKLKLFEYKTGKISLISSDLPSHPYSGGNCKKSYSEIFLKNGDVKYKLNNYKIPKTH